MAQFGIARAHEPVRIAAAPLVGGPAITTFPLGEQLQTTADVVILVTRAIAFDGDVEGEVPALKQPGGDEIGLELGDRFDDEFKLVPFTAFLFVGRGVPKHGHRQAARAGQHEPDGRARQFDFAARGFPQLQACGLRLDDEFAMDE